MVRFNRVHGSVADVKELEYVAALSQTCIPETRKNGTISSLDISRLLSSRYGLFISQAEAVQIVRHLSGETGYTTADLIRKKRRNRKKKKQRKTTNNKNKNSSSCMSLSSSTKSSSKENYQQLDDDVALTSEELLALDDNDDCGDGGGCDDDGFEIVLSSAEDYGTRRQHHSTTNGKKFVHFDLRRRRRRDESEKETAKTTSLSANDGTTTSGAVGVPVAVGPAGDNDTNGGSDLPEEYFDILQVVAILLIPTLARAGKDYLRNDHTVDETIENNETIRNLLLPTAAAAETSDTDQQPKQETKKQKQQQQKRERVSRKERRTMREQARIESLNPQPPTLIQDALRMILKDVSVVPIAEDYDDDDDDDEWPPTVSIELIESILLEMGEHERAQDFQLMQEMVSVATSPSGRLDEEALINAITCDIGDWEVGSEDRMSPFFADVTGHTRGDNPFPLTRDSDSIIEPPKSAGKDVEDPKAAQYHASQPLMTEKDEKSDAVTEEGYDFKGHSIDHSSIDFVVDTHSSVFLVVVIWMFYILLTITYGTLFKTIVEGPPCDAEDFWCQLADVVWVWVAFAMLLTAFGVLIILPLSIGNNPNGRTPFRAIIAIGLTVAYCIVPYGIVNYYRENKTEPYNSSEETMSGLFYGDSQNAALGLGIVVAAWFLWFFVLSLFPRRPISTYSYWFKKILVTSNTNGEFRLKKAATRKINVMLMNAKSLQVVDKQPSTLDSSTRTRSSMLDTGPSMEADQTMLNFFLNGQQVSSAGGLFWTLRLLFTGEYFDTEGLWIPTRMLIFQFAQFVCTCLIGYAAFASIPYIADEAARAQESIEGRDNLPDWIIAFVPTEEDVRIALYPAATIAVISAVLLTLLYIPSATSTILKYRCGVLPSLGSPLFVKYRMAVDTVHMNIGNAIYGLIGAASLYYFIVGLTIFLFIWDFSRPLMLKILAWFVGLMTTILVKMIFTKSCRRTFQKAFYRTRPRASNITTLLLECWHIGLGGSVLVGRVTQFILAAVFWLGRIDVPYLSKNVQILGYGFDYVPTHFAKDLLVHEAHRHPYIERLTQMYLMKLNYPSFGSNRAAVTWRQVLVAAMMPWFRKFRVFRDERLNQSLESLCIQVKELGEDSTEISERFVADFSAIQDAAMNAIPEKLGDEMKAVKDTVESTGVAAVNGMKAAVVPDAAPTQPSPKPRPENTVDGTWVLRHYD